MKKSKTLTNFPEAFHPITVIIGDRREYPPKTMADILAYSVSTTDILFLLHLDLGKVDVVSDKIFVLEDHDSLVAKFGETNLLVIGSPAVNLLARRINDHSLFSFNISEDAKRKLDQQERILDKIKFDQVLLQIYREILLGVRTKNELLQQLKQWAFLSKDFQKKGEELFELFKKTGLKKWKDLMHEFDRPGISDPIDGTIHGASPKEHLDYGLISIASNPFAQSDEYAAVFVAGVHGPATAQCVKLLSDKRHFKEHPYGGVVEVQINLYKGWTEKLYTAIPDWQTKAYEEKSPKVPDKLLRIIYSQTGMEYKARKTVFMSSPYSEDNKQQLQFNRTIRKCFEQFHRRKGLYPTFVDPYSLNPVGHFVGEIVKKFQAADYIIHDVTGFAQGVLFEVGIALGKRRDFFLLWDKSRGPFAKQGIPELLRNYNVIVCDFDDLKGFKRTLTDKVFGVGVELSANSGKLSQDGLQRRSQKTVKKEAAKKELAYISVPRHLTGLRNHIAKLLRKYDIFVLSARNLPDDANRSTLAGLGMAQYCFVDISDGDLNGIVKLGVSEAMGKRDRTLLLFKETTDKTVPAMWKGRFCEWPGDAWRETVQEKVEELVEWVRESNAAGK